MCDFSEKINKSYDSETSSSPLFASKQNHLDQWRKIDEYKLAGLIVPEAMQNIDRSSHEDNHNQSEQNNSGSSSNTSSFARVPLGFSEYAISSSSAGSSSVTNQNERYKEFLVISNHELENSTNARSEFPVLDLNISHSDEHQYNTSLSFGKLADLKEIRCNESRGNKSSNSNCARLILNEMESALMKFCSVTTSPSQLSLNDMLLKYNKNLGAPGSSISFTKNEKSRSFFTPSHSLKEIEGLEWPYLLSVNRLDIIYNTNIDCENLEGLFRRYIESFIGIETSSSYNSRKCSTAKRTVEQLKVAGQSPGSRLSHLANRRKIFSSANLKSSSLNTNRPTTSGRLFLIDKSKLYSKVSNDSKQAATKKKTPKSAKRQQRYSPLSKSIHASSKRALFTSPINQSTEIKKLARETLYSPINDENKKRKLSTSPKQDSNHDRRKQPRIASPSKFLKSQSFSVASPASYKNSFRKKLFTKTQSEIFSQSSDSSSMPVSLNLGYSGVLDEVVKQKILWSVSLALDSKQISNTHEKFKEFASILAKLVKKVFLEFHNPAKSISGELMKFSTQMVYYVINGHSSDQVYKNTKELLQAKHSMMQKNTFSRATCSSLSFSQQSENSTEKEQSENISSSLSRSSSKSWLALRENMQSGNKSDKKFGSDSNLTKVNPSTNILKAKRQISF